MKKSVLSLLISALLLPAVGHTENESLLFNKEWTFNHSIESEISAFDSLTGSIWVAGVTGVDILDVATGNQMGFINTSLFGEINSVAIHNGVAAFGIENMTRTDNGIVQFYDTSNLMLTNTVTVGALPDMVKYTPDGTKLLVANEGSPTVYDNPAMDPAGSVSIINMADYSVSTANLNGVATTGTHIRTNTGMDFEPEYIAVNASGTKAYVTLQEANAIGVLDINSSSFEKVIGLGVKDFSAPGNTMDPSDKDGIVFGSHDVKGLYMPDGITSFEKDGQTYLVMANEGDYREDDEDKARAGKEFGTDAPLDRLQISTTDSTANDLFVAGARSFSIRDEDGNIIYDSGDELDIAAAEAGIYNEKRSDDKGVEPEGVELLTLGDKTYAFVGLERTTTSAVAVYDITDPESSSFLDLIVTEGDLAPEGLQAFQYNNINYFSINNEKSGTTSLYSIAAVPEPETYAMLLAGLALVGRVAKRKKSA